MRRFAGDTRPRSTKRVQKVGRTMREARIAAGLSVFDVARGTGYSATTVQRWEAGSAWPSVRALYAFADACGCDIREILP
jgi:transcriptional regulator with XRE-family HTH domain